MLLHGCYYYDDLNFDRLPTVYYHLLDLLTRTAHVSELKPVFYEFDSFRVFHFWIVPFSSLFFFLFFSLAQYTIPQHSNLYTYYNISKLMAFGIPQITFAWCPTTPILATGSYHDKASQLELFQLSTDGSETVQKSIGKVNSSSRLTALAWGHSQTTSPLGIIAAGTHTGGLELWNPNVIVDSYNSGTRNAFISQKPTTHTQSIFYMEFNQHQPNLLVTAGSDNEVFIWDLANNPEIPYTPGAHSSTTDEQLTKVAWNCQVPYILSTCFSNGQTVILDLRSKKKVMELAAKDHLSSMVWHPDIATQLVTASTDDTHPVVMSWDLRRAHTPEKTMQAHSKGVLDLSWCRQDSDLLVSSGKDGRILGWNPRTALHSEIAKTTSPSAQIDFCPRNPNWLASASLSGEINVWSIQHDYRSVYLDTYRSNGTSDDDQYPIKQPPKWLRRPVGATFGFGGKLVMFSHQRPDSQQQKQLNTPKVKMTTLNDKDIVKRASALQYAKIDHQMLLKFVDQKCLQPDVDEHWLILKILFAENAREQLVNHLGLDKQTLLLQKELVPSTLQSSPPSPSPLHTTNLDESIEWMGNHRATLSGIFKSADGSATGNDFFSSTHPDKSTTTPSINLLRDRQITQAVATGDFETAVALCLEDESRMADALLLAISGGPDLFARTRRRYLEHQSQVSYMQLLDHLVRQDLMSFVQNSHVNDWKLVLAVLCTFGASDEFGGLCEALGLRLETAAATLPSASSSHHLDNMLPHPDQLNQHAAACYLASGKLERLLPIWVSDLEQRNNNKGDYIDGLQEFMEKVTVFLTAIEFEDSSMMDSDKRGTLSMTAATRDCQYMDLLYDKYCEYAAFLASNGQLDTAIKYTGLVPDSYYGQPNKVDMAIIRDRICGATSHHGAMLLQKKDRIQLPFGTQHVIPTPQQETTIQLKDLGQHRLFHQPHHLYYGTNQQRLNDSTADTLFMTARDVPYFETTAAANNNRTQQENYFFDSITSKTESPSTLYDDKSMGTQGTNDDVFLDINSMVITSPMTLQSDDMENNNTYFDKGLQHKPAHQRQSMDAPPTTRHHQAHEFDNEQQNSHQYQRHQATHYHESFSIQQHPQLDYQKMISPQQQQQESPHTKHQKRRDDQKSTSPTTMYTSPVDTRNYISNNRGEKSSPHHHRTSPRNHLYRSPQGNDYEKRRQCKII
ncbi:hypothetical protein BC941DRAFT_409696 [Chlamydoabsidia padenii]|nr:hypothetical protein BC941DRAFT_409696 [Chlamydoabsidia padenii]